MLKMEHIIWRIYQAKDNEMYLIFSEYVTQQIAIKH